MIKYVAQTKLTRAHPNKMTFILDPKTPYTYNIFENAQVKICLEMYKKKLKKQNKKASVTDKIKDKFISGALFHCLRERERESK